MASLWKVTKKTAIAEGDQVRDFSNQMVGLSHMIFRRPCSLLGKMDDFLGFGRQDPRDSRSVEASREVNIYAFRNIGFLLQCAWLEKRPVSPRLGHQVQTKRVCRKHTKAIESKTPQILEVGHGFWVKTPVH